MTNRIGPTFASELAAAGLGDGISFDPATGALLSCPDDATAQSYAKVLAAHDPTRQLPLTVTGNQWAFALSNMGLS